MALRNAAITGLLLSTSVSATPTPSRPSQPQKKGIHAPAHRYHPLQKRDTGAVMAHTNGGGWILPVLIGGQQVHLNIDTGSSDLWTASSLMPSDQQSTVTTGEIYDPDQSSNFTYLNGSAYNISYVDGSGSSGPVGIDDIDIGGAIVNMPFGLCSDLRYSSSSSGTRDTDGPVGLGFGVQNSIRPTPQCTFMECLEPYVPAPVFGTNFKKDDTGSVSFGYVDESLYCGEVTGVAVDNSTGQWTVENVQFGSGGIVFDAPSVTLGFDTGNAGLSVPAAFVSAYFSLIPSASKDSNNNWSYDCSDSLPDFDYVFNSVTSGPHTVTVPGANLQRDEDSDGKCVTWLSESGDGGIVNAGLPFYVSEYMMWDQATPALAFAKQIPTPATRGWGYVPLYDEESGIFYK